MGGNAKIVQTKVPKDQTAEVVLTVSDLRKYLRMCHKENQNQIVLDITLPRPMIPKGTST